MESKNLQRAITSAFVKSKKSTQIRRSLGRVLAMLLALTFTFSTVATALPYMVDYYTEVTENYDGQTDVVTDPLYEPGDKYDADKEPVNQYEYGYTGTYTSEREYEQQAEQETQYDVIYEGYTTDPVNGSYDDDASEKEELADVEPTSEDISALGADDVDITGYFECQNFEQEVRELIGKTSGEPIYRSDVEGITELQVSERGITSLAGIEHFVALMYLSAGHNQLTQIDVTNNLYLRGINLASNGENRIESIDLSNNGKLYFLDLFGSLLTSLDVSNNPFLRQLSVGGNGSNQLSKLDLSNNIYLEQLCVAGNNLSDIDVSEHFYLQSLGVGNNQFSSLDVKNNTELRWLTVWGNNLSTLDISGNPNLVTLDVSGNRLATLNVNNNPELLILWASDNQLTELDVSNNPSIEILDARNNKLTQVVLHPTASYTQKYTFGVTFATRLIDLSKNNLSGTNAIINGARFNWDTIVDMDCPCCATPWPATPFVFHPQRTEITHYFECPNFEQAVRELIGKTNGEPIDRSDVETQPWLSVSGRGITSLAGIEHFTELGALWADNNQLTTLNVSNNSMLRTLNVTYNDLTSVTLHPTAPYEAISLSRNRMISTNDIENGERFNWDAIVDMDCPCCGISWPNTPFQFHPQRIEITHYFVCPNFLQAVREHIGKTNGEPIYSSDFYWITQLYIRDRNITSLAGIEHFTSLAELSVGDNHLTTLDLSQNSALQRLVVWGNRLTTLDLSSNPALEYLQAWGNELTSVILYYSAQFNSITVTSNRMTSTNDIINGERFSWGASVRVNEYYNGQHWYWYDIPFLFHPQRIKITDDFVCSNFEQAVRELIGKTNGEPIYRSDVEVQQWLNVSGRGITSLAGIEHFTELGTLWADNNQLTTLDVSNNSMLRTLSVTYNDLTSVTLHPTAPYEAINLSRNRMISTNDIENGAHIRWDEYIDMMCCCTPFTSMPFLFHPQRIENRDITYYFTCLNFRNAVRANVELEPNDRICINDVNRRVTLAVNNRNITSLAGIEHFAALENLWASQNQLVTLDMSNNPMLRVLSVGWNELTQLNVSNNPELWLLNAPVNYLREMNVSNNPLLRQLDVRWNYLSSVDAVIGWRNAQYLPQIDTYIGYMPTSPGAYTFFFNDQRPSTPRAELVGTATISGNAEFGETLKANSSNLTSDPAIDQLGTVSYRWYRDSTFITGATSSTYTLVQADIGQTITVRVTTANTDGHVESAPTATVARRIPVIGDLTYNLTAVTFNNTPRAVTVTGAVGLGEITVEYTLGGTTYWTTTAPTNAGTYSVRVRVAESATHSAGEFVLGYFTINPLSLTGATITLSGTVFDYTNSEITPDVTSVVIGGINVPENAFTVSYSDNMSPGTGQVTVTATPTGNFSGNESTTFTIVGRAIPASDIIAPSINAMFNGAEHGITVSDTAGAGIVTFRDSNGEYTLPVSPTFVDAGVHTVRFRVVREGTGFNPFYGSATVTITARQINDTNVSIYIPAQTFTGSALTPAPTAATFAGSAVSGSNVTLVQGTHFTLSNWQDNTNAGQASVTVTGRGNFSGTRVIYFTIGQATWPPPGFTFPTSATPIAFGQPLSASTLTGGTTGFGAFAWTNPTDRPDAGIHYFSVTFTTNALTRQNFVVSDTVEQDVGLTVNRANQPVPAIEGPSTVVYIKDDTSPVFSATIGGESTGALDWRSSNENVATIDADGEVTVLEAGSTSITVRRLGDNNHNDSPWSASVVLTIFATQCDADIAAAVSMIEGATYAALQADVMSIAQARVAVEAIIAGLPLADGIETTVVNGTFTAAIAGTQANLSGTNGSFTFTVNVTTESGDAEPQTTRLLTLTITATPTTPLPPPPMQQPGGVTFRDPNVSAVSSGNVNQTINFNVQINLTQAGRNSGFSTLSFEWLRNGQVWAGAGGNGTMSANQINNNTPIQLQLPGGNHAQRGGTWTLRISLLNADGNALFTDERHVTTLTIGQPPQPPQQPAASPPPAITQPPITTPAAPAAAAPVATPVPSATQATAPVHVPRQDRELMPASDVSIETVEAAINSNEAVIIALSEDAYTMISEETLQVIRENGEVLYIELANGIVLGINPDTITDYAIAIDLNMLVILADTAEDILIGSEVVNIPANSIVLLPPTHGEFGFAISINMTTQKLSDAGLNGNNFRLYHISTDGEKTEMDRVRRNSDGSVTVTITHASAFILREEPFLSEVLDSEVMDSVIATPETDIETMREVVLPHVEPGEPSVTIDSEPTGNVLLGIIGGISAVAAVGGLAIVLLRRKNR